MKQMLGLRIRIESQGVPQLTARCTVKRCLSARLYKNYTSSSCISSFTIQPKFPSTLRRRNLKKQQSPVSLDLCLRKTRSGKSHDFRDATVLDKFRF